MSLRWLYFFFFLAFAYFAKIVFVPLFLSIFSAILLEPFVLTLTRRRLSRHLASVLAIVLFLLVSAGVLWLGYLSFTSLASGASNFSENLGRISTWFKELASKFDFSSHANPTPKVSTESIQKVQVVDAYPGWTSYLLTGMGSLSEGVTMSFFVPLMLFYFLYDKENLIESFNTLVGKHCYLPKLNLELPKMIRAFVTANAITLILLFFGHGLVLYFLGFNNWISLTLITAFLSLIPLVGAPLAILLPLTQGLPQSVGTFPFLVLAVAFLSFHIIANNLILPQLIGSKINVNTAALIFGLLFWGWLWGGIGFILAVPMTALVKIFLESNPETVPLANLLSAKPRHVLTARKPQAQNTNA